MIASDNLIARPWRTVGILCACLVVALILSAGVQGKLGHIGPDNDDVMRLVQVRDLLAGQGWFDLVQSRLGPDGGTPMHWSRLVDLPIAALAAVFDIFLPSSTALAVAYSVWPPLTACIVLAGVFLGARNLRDDRTALIATLMSAVVLLTHFRFAPGAIDHHNLQLGMLAIALGLTVGPKRRVVHMAGSGLALAASIAIGAEVYVFVAIFCAFVALDWAVTGEPARRGAIAFGLGLSAGLSAFFLSLIGPHEYGAVACDAISAVSMLAGAAGGVGLAGAAYFLSTQNVSTRLAALGALAVVCGLVLVDVGPQCLSNPLDELSPLAKSLWLDKVSEARPVFAPGARVFETVPYRLGVISLAFGLCAYQVWRRKDMRAALLLCTLLAASFFTTVYQLRFFAIGHLFAMLPLGIWVAESWIHGKARKPDSVTYVGAIALSLPMIWGMSGKAVQTFASSEIQQVSTREACVSDALYEVMNELPAGRVLASSNFTPYLLLETHHAALNGNYHRNMKAIDASLSILVSDPADGRATALQWGVDYVLVCQADPSVGDLVEYAPDGVLARLQRGEPPEWLERVASADAEGIKTHIYSVRN